MRGMGKGLSTKTLTTWWVDWGWLDSVRWIRLVGLGWFELVGLVGIGWSIEWQKLSGRVVDFADQTRPTWPFFRPTSRASRLGGPPATLM
jgi:hypothetical protein